MFFEEIKQLISIFIERMNLFFISNFNNGVLIHESRFNMILIILVSILIIFIILFFWFVFKKNNKKSNIIEDSLKSVAGDFIESNEKSTSIIPINIPKNTEILNEQKEEGGIEYKEQDDLTSEKQPTVEKNFESKNLNKTLKNYENQNDEKFENSISFFENLQKAIGKTRKQFLSNISNVILGKKRIDEDLLDDLEEVLIGSDIGPETTLHIIEAITEKVERNKLMDPQILKKEIQNEISKIMDKKYPMQSTMDRKPLILLIVGVNGVGKTTTIGKIASIYRQKGKKVLMGAADTFRAAAIEQLFEWSKKVDCSIYHKTPGSDPSSVIHEAVQKGIDEEFDVVICDTAGRLHTKKNLMEELKKMVRVIQKLVPDAPHEVLLVLDATTGQNAIFQTREFKEKTNLTGLIITKLDGTSKGGVVIGIVNEFDIPVRFIGIGEKVEDLRPFDAKQFAESIFK